MLKMWWDSAGFCWDSAGFWRFYEILKILRDSEDSSGILKILARVYEDSGELPTPRKNWTLKVRYFFMKFMQVHENALNLTSELRKKQTLKVQYFFMKMHDNALNLTSELRKKWTWKVQYFFMKIHASIWQCIESHIWTKKNLNFESSIFFM
jgi:hypothetical protein